MTPKNNTLLAIIDEYIKAASDYKNILSNLPESEFIIIKDDRTKDPDCRSIQTITYHIVASGYTYINYINAENEKDWFEYKDNLSIENFSCDKAIIEIDKMLNYTEESFMTLHSRSNEEISKWSFKVRWGVTYNFEQLMEHAIVHILRHRRQIEKFLI